VRLACRRLDRSGSTPTGIEMEFSMAILQPASLHLLARSFVVQALVATATIALVSASSPVATADPAAASPGPTTLASR
jgi:hypothetical protein